MTLARFAVGVLGGVLLPGAVCCWIVAVRAGGATIRCSSVVVGMLTLPCCLAGELFERYLFFAAVRRAEDAGSACGMIEQHVDRTERLTAHRVALAA